MRAHLYSLYLPDALLHHKTAAYKPCPIFNRHYMTEFEKQYAGVQEYLEFGEWTLAIKRIIDFTLDTGSPAYYSETLALLEWLDHSNADEAVIIERLKAALQRLYEPLSKMPVAEKKLLIAASNLSKHYKANPFSLGPVDLDVYEGQIIGLVGENGNGKTTLLRTLCGELHPSGGTLEYAFPAVDAYDRRTQLVYIPQRTETWYGPVMENLEFAAALYGYNPDEISAVTELTVARLGLRKFRKYRWKDLSSGYKMRFELARMLLRKPKILLIDEPLANLDILAQQTVLEDFRAIAKSPFRPLGIILSSQQLYEVEKTSDQVIFLKNGRQQNLFDTGETMAERPFVAEIQSPWSQGELVAGFGAMLNSLEFNGGTYIATFSAGFDTISFIKLLADREIPVTYFRDISNSTRRFFVS